MADMIFGFVVLVLGEIVVLFLLLMIAATLKVIKQDREELSKLKATVEVTEKEAIEEFLRGYEVEGRTMEEWFALIKKQEAEHGTERVDTGTPDGRSDI